MIKVYHGSYVAAERPDISFSRDTLDFGRGFCVTPRREQAMRWALRWERRHRQAVVNTCIFHDELIAGPDIKFRDFQAYDRERLRFVAANRDGMPAEKALEFFYHSETYRELSEGIADLHCRGDRYIVEDLQAEYRDR